MQRAIAGLAREEGCDGRVCACHCPCGVRGAQMYSGILFSCLLWPYTESCGGSLVFDDVLHEEHIPDEASADVEDQHSGVEPEVQNPIDQDQLADSNPIFQVDHMSNTPHLQSQDPDINSDDADRSGPHPKRDPKSDTVIVTHQSNQGTSPEPAESEPLVSREPTTRRGEKKAWDYYIDIAAARQDGRWR